MTSLNSDTDAINIHMWKLISFIYRVYTLWSLIICNGLSDGHFTRPGSCILELYIDFNSRYINNPKGASYAMYLMHEYLWNHCINIWKWQGHMLRKPDFKTNIFWHPDSHYPLISTNLPCNNCNMQENRDWYSCIISVRFIFLSETN